MALGFSGLRKGHRGRMAVASHSIGDHAQGGGAGGPWRTGRL